MHFHTSRLVASLNCDGIGYEQSHSPPNNGVEERYPEGREEGPNEDLRDQALAIAGKWLTLGESVEKVAEWTGLSLGDLQKL